MRLELFDSLLHSAQLLRNPGHLYGGRRVARQRDIDSQTLFRRQLDGDGWRSPGAVLFRSKLVPARLEIGYPESAVNSAHGGRSVFASKLRATTVAAATGDPWGSRVTP